MAIEEKDGVIITPKLRDDLIASLLDKPFKEVNHLIHALSVAPVTTVKFEVNEEPGTDK